MHFSSELCKRIASGTLMLACVLSILMHLGHLAHLFLIFVLQSKAFTELKNIGLTSQLGTTQVRVDWMLFFIANGVMLAGAIFPTSTVFLFSLICYASVTGFWIIGVLNKNKDKLQVSILHYSWVHLVLFFTAPQTLFISLNLESGLFWFIFPCLTVTINDSSAYFIGKLFGRHKLISLSPNKTTEGLIGAAVMTVSIGYLLALLLSHSESLFHNTHPTVHHHIGLHGFVIALFTAIFAPTGDLVGSVIKRAGKAKDFDNIIPGHGGISDRVDSHLFMGALTYLYYQSITQDA